MPRIVGSVEDAAGRPAVGAVRVRAVGVRKSHYGNSVVDERPYDIPIVDGVITGSPVVDPGPVQLSLRVSGGRNRSWDVVVPDVETVDLWDLIEAHIDYEPIVVAKVFEYMRRAEAAAVDAFRLPAGGEDGQILVKSGDGFTWADLPTGGAPGEEEPAYGPLATASPAYRSVALAAKAGTGRLRIVTIGDSTGDGYAGGQAGAPTSWAQTWPVALGPALRTRFGLGAGGRGWVAPATPLAEANYAYTVATRTPAGYGRDDLADQIGIPGSLWLQDGHGSNADKVTWTLDPTVTSVDLILAAYGNALTVTTTNGGVQTISPTGDPVTVRIPNPGVSLSIENGIASGFAVMGMVEYRGDETTGITTWNLTQASTTAETWAYWLSGIDMTLSPVLAEYAPHVALVCLGSNDLDAGRTTAQLRQSLATIHASLTAASPGIVVVFLVRDLPEAEWGPYADAIVSQAATLGAHALDLRSVVPASHPTAYVADGVHLNVAGNNLYATAVAEYMRVGASTSP